MIIALNNKSNLDKYEFLKYQEELGTIETNFKVIACPTLLNINLFVLSKVSLGAQNVSSRDEGAYTGEVSAKDLKSSGVEYCIVGHSERREYQKETNEEIHEKIVKLLENDIRPILCVGETKEEREQNKTNSIIKEELDIAIKDLTAEEKSKIIVAYEPIWAIGTGLIPTIAEIDEVLKMIKEMLPDSPVLYGGSANNSNVEELKESKLIEGYLLGGLSLKVNDLKQFIKLLEA